MPLRVHWLQHVSFEGLGAIGPWLDDRGHSATRTRLFAGETLPEPADFDWLIAMGGPMNADNEAHHPWLGPEKRLIAAAIAADRRVLGICLGAQLMARALGADVAGGEPEIGWFEVEMVPMASGFPLFGAFRTASPIFTGTVTSSQFPTAPPAWPAARLRQPGLRLRHASCGTAVPSGDDRRRHRRADCPLR